MIIIWMVTVFNEPGQMSARVIQKLSVISAEYSVNELLGQTRVSFAHAIYQLDQFLRLGDSHSLSRASSA